MNTNHTDPEANQLGRELEAAGTTPGWVLAPPPQKPVSTYTDLAVDAFRRQEQARRRLALAEAKTLAALRLVPRDELGAYMEATDAIRLKMDGEDLHGRPRRPDELDYQAIVWGAEWPASMEGPQGRHHRPYIPGDIDAATDGG
jgi:hypothetical protein